MTHTIAAISTAYGRGGVAVIRISGDEAIEIAERMFAPRNGKRLCEISSNSAVYGHIKKGGVTIDDGVCTIFRAPSSYTGEDTAEICCHGGILLTEKVLEAAFECGAVPAQAGEFTKRAFVNGKLSLSQAEAVGMLIDAESEEMLTLAGSHQRGVMKRESERLYNSLKTIVTGVYANVDFPDEDLAELSNDEVLERLSHIEGELSALKASYKVGKAVCEGIKTVIVGKPNTGKSSLLNRLVGRNRAIVTDIAGTTRDTIEETVTCSRVLLRLCDTAGIRESGDEVERMGVERSIEALNEAELVLAVFDSSRELDFEDGEVLEKLSSVDCPKIAIINKCDLPKRIDTSALEPYGFVNTIEISASSENAEESGIDTLKGAICELFAGGVVDYNTRAVLTNARQHASVTRALDYVRNAVYELSRGSTADTAGFDLELALSELSELDGKKVTEDIVADIFRHFCVGK